MNFQEFTDHRTHGLTFDGYNRSDIPKKAQAYRKLIEQWNRTDGAKKEKCHEH